MKKVGFLFKRPIIFLEKWNQNKNSKSKCMYIKIVIKYF